MNADQLNEMVLKILNSVYHHNDPEATHRAVLKEITEITTELFRPETTSNAKTDND